MNDFIGQLTDFASLMKENALPALACVSILWAVFFISLLTGQRLNYLGIYPRKMWGLPGIFLHTFLHANLDHLFFNSIPLLVLIDFLLMEGQAVFIQVSLIIILGSGFAVWCLGRRAIHIGASSLIMGYWSYLLLHAYRQPTLSSIILALICLYYFGGLLFDLFPREEKVSWEGHLFGFLAGLLAVYLQNVSF